MGFLLSLKESWNRGRIISTVLLNLLQIELLMVLTLNKKMDIIDDVQNSIFPLVDSIETQNNGEGSLSIISTLLLVANVLLFAITLLQSYVQKTSILYSKKVHEGTVQLIKIFPYIGFVPLVVYELQFLQGENIENKVISLLNVVFFVILAEIELVSSWSYRFKEVDFCNSRHSQQVPFLLTLLFLALRQFVSPIYCSIAYLLNSLSKLVIVLQFHQYQLIQKLMLFYGIYGVYFFVIVFTGDMMDTEIFADPVYLAAILIFGSAICYFLLDPILIKQCHYRIQHGTQLNLIQQPESQPQNQSKKIRQTQNTLRILTTIFLEKQKYDQHDENSQFPHWWQTYNRLIMIHKINCLKVTCMCKRMKITPQDQALIYTLQLLNLGQSLCNLNTKQNIPKLLSIYLLVEIAKKPLKAYYELIRFKQEKTSNDRYTLVELEYLTKQTRECFAQVFAKNKAMNQELQLLKVIQYEQLMSSLDIKVNALLDDIILFYELFLLHTAKASKIKEDSLKINKKKEQVQRQFYNLIMNFADSVKLSMMITLFYNFIEIYRSKEKQLRKIGSQLAIRKRIYHKADSNIFSPHFGSVYIDLVQQRGKILNLTSNMCAAFGYTREEMVGYNVKRFMPTIYARHHDRFLSNFVQKGKLRLLRSKQRVIFAKNKKKFIFPVNVRLKAEYLLQNQFGSSSLINAVDTSSEFIMVGMNGKLQEITQGLYRKLFYNIYKDEVGKCNRLSVFKLIPTLNKLHDPSQEPNPNRICEGLVLTSSSEQTLTEKFRYARDIISTGGTIGSGGTYISSGSLTNKSKMSIIEGRTITAAGSMGGNEIFDMLAETFRIFLVDLNIFSLKGFKISYKISNVHTSEFDLMIIEVVSIEPIEPQSFFTMLIEQLRTTAQIYQLNELHGPVLHHLEDMERMCKDKNNESRLGSPELIDILRKLSLAKPQPAYGEVKRRRESYSSHRMITLMSEMSVNSLLSDKNEVEEFNQRYEQSDHSSMMGSTETESKRQLLLAAFNSSQTIISSHIGLFFTSLLIVQLLIKATIGVLVFTFVNDNLDLWRDVKTMFLIEQVSASWVAIQEVETFAQNWKGESPLWGEMLKSAAIERMKANLQQLPLMTEPPKQFYTQLVNLTDSTTNSTQQVSLIELLNNYFYMMSYHDDVNIEKLRSYRAQVRLILLNLRNQRLAHNNDVEAQSRLHLYILISVYTFLLLLIHIFVLGIYLHYRSEQERIVSLLSYMNRRQIKKQIFKLNEVKSFLKDKDKDPETKNMTTDFKMKESLTIIKKTTPLQYQRQPSTPRKSLKLQVQNDRNNINSLKKTKIILILLLSFTFLSNFGIVTFWATFEGDNFFRINTNAGKVVFDFENRVPILIGSVLGNVNNVMATGKEMKFAENGTGRSKLFVPLKELAMPNTIKSPIAGLTQELFPSPLCSIVECSNGEGNHGTISFESLIYNFYKRFQILLPVNPIMGGDTLIQDWVNESNIITLVSYLQQIIQFSTMINSQIDSKFSQQSAFLSLVLIVCFVVMIPLNILIVLYAERKLFHYLSHILTSSEGIYNHFPVNVLSENTYLISYFNSKVKNNK